MHADAVQTAGGAWNLRRKRSHGAEMVIHITHAPALIFCLKNHHANYSSGIISKVARPASSSPGDGGGRAAGMVAIVYSLSSGDGAGSIRRICTRSRRCCRERGNECSPDYENRREWTILYRFASAG